MKLNTLLTALKGSVKQSLWAEEIRKIKMDEILEIVEQNPELKENSEKAVAWLGKIEYSSFWTKNRNLGGDMILAYGIMQVSKEKKLELSYNFYQCLKINDVVRKGRVVKSVINITDLSYTDCIDKYIENRWVIRYEENGKNKFKIVEGKPTKINHETSATKHLGVMLGDEWNSSTTSVLALVSRHYPNSDQLSGPGLSIHLIR